MKRFKHSLSHQRVLSLNMGYLTPIGLTHVNPGDTFRHNTTALLRVSPLLAPIMHRVEARIHHWFVPHRLVWDEFETFITGGADGDSAPVFPTITAPTDTPTVGFPQSSLADYLGIKPAVNGLEVSALPFRGYYMIYNEFYRDQDLVDLIVWARTSGPDTTTPNILPPVAWEKDYFTLARPTPQKGADVMIPFTIPANSPVERVSNAPSWEAYTLNSDTKAVNGDVRITSTPSAGQVDNTTARISFDPMGGLQTDNSDFLEGSILDLRRAFAIQRFEEARSVWGSRYTEYLRYLGIRPSDARLQRPEYLGGGTQTIQFSEVVQSAPGEFDAVESPLGTLGGHGIGAMKSNRYQRFFEEHGYVFTLLSIRPKAVYTDALERHFLYRTKEEFFQKELQFIGQQEVFKGEIYPQSSSTTNRETWGYINRYEEYRRQLSGVSGEFRTTLDYWGMWRKLASLPTLNSDFVNCFPTDRVYASTDTDEVYAQVHHSIQARRLIAPTGGSSRVI